MIPSIADLPARMPPDAAALATNIEPGPGASTTATDAKKNPIQSIFVIYISLDRTPSSPGA